MNLIIFLPLVVSTQEYKVKFSDGIKSYKFDRFYEIFDVFWLTVDQGTEQDNLLTLDNFSSDTFEILRNASNEKIKEISIKEFISCCKMLIELDWFEISAWGQKDYLSLKKVYETLCNNLHKKSYCRDTFIYENEDNLLIFNYKNWKVFFITESIENFEQLFSFLKSKDVKEIRILYEYLNDELLDELSKNKVITKLFVMSEDNNKVDIDFGKISHIDYLSLDVNCDLRQIITNLNNLSHLKIKIENLENEDIKLIGNKLT